MRGSYNAAANQNAAQKRQEKIRKRCGECDERKAEIEEKNQVRFFIGTIDPCVRGLRYFYFRRSIRSRRISTLPSFLRVVYSIGGVAIIQNVVKCSVGDELLQI